MYVCVLDSLPLLVCSVVETALCLCFTTCNLVMSVAFEFVYKYSVQLNRSFVDVFCPLLSPGQILLLNRAV